MIGPRPAGGPTTLPAYLTSIGKASFYGIFKPGVNCFANSDGSGGAVATGGAVGCWVAEQAVNWTAKWIQATAASRPLYSTTLSPLGPTISGNGTSWTMSLDSATALNQDCTILMSVETLNMAGYVFTQNGDAWSLYTNVGADPDHYYGTVDLGKGAPQARRSDGTSTAWQRLRRFAVSSGTATTRYGNAMRILGTAGGYFATHRIAQIAIVPKLTSAECLLATQYLV